MSISATYLQLQQQIADELGDRTDLLSVLGDESALTLSPIQNAIQSAVSKWEREPFYFNEAYSSPLFTTVASQEFYTTSDAPAIATAPQLEYLHALINNNRIPLHRRSWVYLEEMSQSTTNSGRPTDWAYFAEQIRLYPMPDGAYPIRATRTQVPTALSANSDTNVWTQDGFDLIKSEAKLILALEVIHDPELAQRMKLAIYGDPSEPRSRGYLTALKAATLRRARTRVRSTSF